MIDIKWLRSHSQDFVRSLQKRGAKIDVDPILHLDMRHREMVTKSQEVRTTRNALAKEIGHRKSQGQDAQDLILQSSVLEKQEETLAQEANLLGTQLQEILSQLPNMLSDEVQEGQSEEENQELRRWGDDQKEKGFPLQDHVTLGKMLGGMDFDQAAKVCGARFVFLSGVLARLERALASWMLDVHTEQFGFTEYHIPSLVRREAVYGAGQLPKFEQELFATKDGRFLISTSEVPLVSLGLDRIFSEDELPLKVTAYTPCFRSEAGAAGKDTRGMMRLHQFEKVELVVICRPEDAAAIHEQMVAQEEYLLQSLGLPYRVVRLCAGDIGAASCKTYDTEVWVQGEQRYREIASCSNCGTYQALRLNTRFRRKNGALEIPFTLNGSGLPTGRTLLALLEHYQTSEGDVIIPEPLRPYMGGRQVLRQKEA